MTDADIYRYDICPLAPANALRVVARSGRSQPAAAAPKDGPRPAGLQAVPRDVRAPHPAVPAVLARVRPGEAGGAQPGEASPPPRGGGALASSAAVQALRGAVPRGIAEPSNMLGAVPCSPAPRPSSALARAAASRRCEAASRVPGVRGGAGGGCLARRLVLLRGVPGSACPGEVCPAAGGSAPAALPSLWRSDRAALSPVRQAVQRCMPARPTGCDDPCALRPETGGAPAASMSGVRGELPADRPEPLAMRRSVPPPTGGEAPARGGDLRADGGACRRRPAAPRHPLAARLRGNGVHVRCREPRARKGGAGAPAHSGVAGRQAHPPGVPPAGAQVPVRVFALTLHGGGPPVGAPGPGVAAGRLGGASRRSC